MTHHTLGSRKANKSVTQKKTKEHMINEKIEEDDATEKLMEGTTPAKDNQQ